MKTLNITLLAIVVLLLLGYFVAIPLLSSQLIDRATNYRPITHQQVFDSEPMKTIWYGIGDKKNPGDYGYKNWQEVEYPSIYDQHIKLNAWWVQSATTEYGASKAPVIVLSHGRTANRLKPMKFLEMFQQLGLDKHYNFLIPDHRNSGKSSAAITELGNKFAEDLAAASFFCHDNYASQQFIYYSFSMGAMATAILMHRHDLKQLTTQRDLEVLGLILDSPLSNVDATLRLSTDNMPTFILDRALHRLASQITLPTGESYYQKMRLSTLLQAVKAPVLILNSEGDITTPANLLRDELSYLSNQPNIDVEWFTPLENVPKNRLHVQMYSHHPQRYQSIIESFFKAHRPDS